MTSEDVQLEIDGVTLQGTLTVPPKASGLVIFAHGSGSSRHSPRNRQVAQHLRDRGLATLLFDLTTAAEERIDALETTLRFDVDMLAERLIAVTDRVVALRMAPGLPIGYFGGSTGAAAALIAAARRPERIAAVVSRGGRPDLARGSLHEVVAPTLLVVGSKDLGVLDLNRNAAELLGCEYRLAIVPGASHLFEEPGTLDQVGNLAATWFVEHFASKAPSSHAVATAR